MNLYPLSVLLIRTADHSHIASPARSNRGAPTHGRCARAPHVRRARDRPTQSAKPRRCGVGAPTGCDGPDGGAGRDARDGCDGRDAGCDCDAPPAPSFAEYSCTYFLILASPGTGSMPWRSSVRTTTRPSFLAGHGVPVDVLNCSRCSVLSISITDAPARPSSHTRDTSSLSCRCVLRGADAGVAIEAGVATGCDRCDGRDEPAPPRRADAHDDGRGVTGPPAAAGDGCHASAASAAAAALGGRGRLVDDERGGGGGIASEVSAAAGAECRRAADGRGRADDDDDADGRF